MNKNSKIIFRVKDGVSPSAVLPNEMLGLGEGGGIQVSRLHDIGNEVASFRENTIAASGGNDDEIFDKEIYATKSEPEQKLFRTYVAEGSREATQSLIESLEANEDVEYVQLDEMNALSLTPDDPLLPQLWGITKIDCPNAWDVSQGEDIVVAVIDTGVDYHHPDIAESMWTNAAGNHGKDFSEIGRAHV